MKAVHKAIYTCEQASKLIVLKNEGKLSSLQRFRLWIHLQMCEACKRFDIQNEWMDKQMKNLIKFEDVGKMPKSKKDEIANRLKDEMKSK